LPYGNDEASGPVSHSITGHFDMDKHYPLSNESVADEQIPDAELCFWGLTDKEWNKMMAEYFNKTMAESLNRRKGNQ